MTQYCSLVQQLAWPARTTLPSIAYEVSDVQQRTSEATLADVVRANFVLRAAQEKTRQGHGLWFRKIGGKLTSANVHDAGFGGQPRCGSQHGFFISMTNTDIFTGEAPINFVDWSSCRIHRTVRSTLAAEAAGGSEGHDRGTWI